MEDEFQSYVVSDIPRRTRPFFPMIAPLWADFNFRDFGSLFYRLATDNSTLEYVRGIVVNITNGNYFEFRPTLAVVATWFQSRFFRSMTEVSLLYYS